MTAVLRVVAWWLTRGMPRDHIWFWYRVGRHWWDLRLYRGKPDAPFRFGVAEPLRVRR